MAFGTIRKISRGYRKARGLRIKLNTSFDTRPLKRELDEIKDRSKDFTPVFEHIREDLKKHWAGNFTANGLPVGGWAPLDFTYGSWKSAHYPGAAPLIQSGKLFRSLTELRGNPNDIGLRRAVFGTDVEYAKFHQMGTSKMPKRQIIYEPTLAKQKWSKWCADYMADGADGLDAN